MLLLIIPILFVLMSSTSSLAATYYIDFVGGADSNTGTSTVAPWKRVKGMTNVTGTAAAATIADGDIIIFKGGVTWTTSYPWTIQHGTASTVTYTVDPAWFTGGAWTQPIFDDLGAHPAGTGMAGMTNGYATLNNLRFTNCGITGTTDSDKCLVFNNSHHLTITNNTFDCYCWITIYLYYGTAGTYTTNTITGNDFSHTTGAIWLGRDAANAVVQTINYSNNVFHDFASQLGGGTHGDGAWHQFSSTPSDSTQYVDGLTFCNNRFYGDFRVSFAGGGGMSGYFFDEGGGKNYLLCNNDMSFDPVQASIFGQGLIVIARNGNAQTGTIAMYGNTLLNNGVNAASSAIDLYDDVPNVTIKNNLFVGFTTPIYFETSSTRTGFTSNYNMFNAYSSNNIVGATQSFAQWNTLGYDLNGVDGGTAGLVDITPPLLDTHLITSSTAKNAGVSLAGLGIAVLNSDLDGLSRPQGSAWDIGAYEFDQGGAGQSPDPPSGGSYLSSQRPASQARSAAPARALR